MVKKSLHPNKTLGLLALFFLGAYFIPFESPRVSGALIEAFAMLGEYAREHVLFCLVPAMFIAGAISVFLDTQAVIRFFGPQAKRVMAYGAASVSGVILAVCSCTVLPLFKGIYRKGAGLGPAISFLYSGPAINVLSIVLSFKVFGWELGMARTIGAVLFSVIIGMVMQFIFRKEDERRLTDEAMFGHQAQEGGRSLGQMILYMASMVGILVFINWADSNGGSVVWDAVYRSKYYITAAFSLLLVYSLLRRFSRDDLKLWLIATRDFSLQVLPYLFGGVLLAGFLLGRPGHNALTGTDWVASLVGGHSFLASLLAALSGAFMYFATLTEVPILQGLLGAGMGKGPALALLLAGPSLSLPSILVIHAELGIKKTAVYAGLVVLLSAAAGWLYGLL